MLSDRARRADRAWRYVTGDDSLRSVRNKLSLYNLDCLIKRVLDAVYDEDAHELETEALGDVSQSEDVGRQQTREEV